MKSTGVIRKIDGLGRIVIPMELRRTLDISSGDPLEIFVDGEKILLRKYNPGCTLCGKVETTMGSYKGKVVCNECLSELRGK